MSKKKAASTSVEPNVPETLDEKKLRAKKLLKGLEKAYPDAEFQVFREAGHNMFWEFPDKAARVINEFLDAPDNP